MSSCSLRIASPALSALLAVTLAIVHPAIANDATPVAERQSMSVDGGHVVPVKVQRQKPGREKHPTLRFLRSNRAFIRGQLDRLRVERLESDGSGDALDPSQVRHRDMMTAIAAAADTLASERAAFDDRDVLARVGDLAAIDAQLGRLDALLGEQRARLAEIEASFIDAQTTAMMLIVRGVPEGTPPAEILIVDDDGAATRIGITAGVRASLENDGLMEVYHEFAEPREQSWRVSLVSPDGGESDPRYVTLRPVAGRLTFIELDLATWTDDSTLAARAWLDAPPDPIETVAERPVGQERRP